MVVKQVNVDNAIGSKIIPKRRGVLETGVNKFEGGIRGSEGRSNRRERRKSVSGFDSGCTKRRDGLGYRAGKENSEWAERGRIDSTGSVPLESGLVFQLRLPG